MGIKFRCPNGHKLNVKSFLGGKRAFCPKCGVRLVVPTAEDSIGSNSNSTAEEADIGVKTTVDAEISTADEGKRSDTAQAAAAPAQVDPIGEAPDAVWYVRPASGGQFGPASAEIMRNWLNEGRVGAGSLVWRAGWPEWRPAVAVFAQLSPASVAPDQVTRPTDRPATSPSAVVSANGPPPLGGRESTGQMVQSHPTEQPLQGPPGLSSSVPPLTQSALRRRRQNERRLYVSAVLVVVSVILFIVLFVVFQRQGQQADPQSQEASQPAEDLLE